MITQSDAQTGSYDPNVFSTQVGSAVENVQRTDAAHTASPRSDNEKSGAHFRGTLLRVVLKALNSNRFDDSVSTLCSDVQKLLGCQAVAMATRDAHTGVVRLVSISTSTSFDRRSPLVRDVENAMRETLLIDQPTADPQVGKAKRSPAIVQLRSRWGTDGTVLAAPLRVGKQPPSGAWVLVVDLTYFESSDNQTLLAETSATLATCMATLAEKHASLSQRTMRRSLAFIRSRRGAISGGIVVLCLLLGMTPWPYRIGCEGVCEPASRRFVAAPFDGILKQAVATPGDVVTTGDVLAQLDGQALQSDIAAVDAERKQARQRYEAALAAREAGDAAIERLKLAQLDARHDLLLMRNTQLTIRSPAEGVVVSGDMVRVEGAPVTLGQVLFEVAALDDMLIEAQIPEAEMSRASEGMTASVRFDAEPSATYSGVVERLHPRAEIRQDQNVFIATVALDDDHPKLRPGMHATVQLNAGRRSLAWIGFHRPLEFLRTTFGW